MEENTQPTGNKKIYMGIIVLLLIINGAALVLLYSERRAKNDLGEQKTKLEQEFHSLSDSLDSKKAELEQFRGKNVELDSIITAKQDDIDKQKKQISSMLAKGKMNAAELEKAKGAITQYEASIADLQKKVDDLTKQNQQLTTQNQQLSTDLSTEKQTSSQLVEQNKGLSKKVELGSLLQLKNIEVVGTRKKGSGDDKVEKKAKHVEKLRITFETGDNKVLESGPLSLYIRIINPKGETISVADQGSGNMQVQTGENIQYTEKADIDWAQANKKVVAYWGTNIKDAGTYKIEIYQSGYLVGSGFYGIEVNTPTLHSPPRQRNPDRNSRFAIQIKATDEQLVALIFSHFPALPLSHFLTFFPIIDATMKRSQTYFLVVLLLSSCAGKPAEGKRGKIFPHVAVVSAYPDASKVGADILKKGGNAADAAVAVSFALEVVYPGAGNIGGGGFMVVRMANGEANALDYREKAPLAATRDMYLDKDSNVIAGRSLNGLKASGVPGTVDGMFTAQKQYGKLPWKDVIQPAIDIARNGFTLTKMLADELNSVRADFLKYNPQSTYLLNDKGWKEGDTLKQEDLAKTLELIRDSGRAGFYGGVTAQRIVAAMKSGDGLITAEDLQNYHSIWRKPVTGTYKGYGIITMPPPSSGGVALMQLLKMMERAPVSNTGFHTAETVHRMVEAENRVYADRAKWLGDPDFFDVPVQQLLDSIYIVHRMDDFNPKSATPPSSIKAGDLVVEKEQTTHYSVVDQWGNAVAVTTTLNGTFGNRCFVNGAGFLLNNEMDDFSIKPGVPNMFGLVGGEANAIAPCKRMLSSMTPTIVTKNGKLFMVVGSPGGSTIITTVFQTILNVVDFDMTIQEAVNAKRFHSQWLPDEIMVEKNGLDSTVILKLQQMGHKISKPREIGRCDAILALPDGKYETGADNRGDDDAEGW